MKATLLATALLVSIVLQFFLLQSWQVDGLTANIVLSFIVIVSLHAKTKQLMWLSLLAGLSSDLYAAGDFGFYLGFYLLVAIISKYWLKFGERDYSWWRPILYLAFVATIQALVVSLPLLNSSPVWQLAQQVASYVLLTTVAGLIWYILLSQISQWASGDNRSRAVR